VNELNALVFMRVMQRAERTRSSST